MSCVALAVALSGCDSLRYREARFLEGLERYPAAVRAYERELAADPDGPRAAEANVRAADIYARRFERCVEARPHYEAAARLDPHGPWGARGRAGIMDCPDYFPLDAGRTWVYGDSASGGRAMRLEWQVRESSGGESGVILAARYAGNRRQDVEEETYRKRHWEVLETSRDARNAVILRYPYRTGERWTTSRNGVRFSYRIEDADAKAQTAAGAFEHCLKVRETNLRFPGSWAYHYYAPFVGPVKTTIAGPRYEHPNVELLKWSAGT